MLQDVTFRNLRCIETSGCRLHPSLTVLAGRNAQGKTSVLEGLYLLALGRSFRTRRLAQLVRTGAEVAAVEGVTDQGVTLRAAVQGKDRHLFLNGVECSFEDYLGSLRAVVYSSELLPVVKGDPEAGRRFLDRGVALLDPSYLHVLSRGLRAVRQRNQLLKQAQQESWALARVKREIRPWDELLLKANADVIERRSAFCARLNGELARLPEDLRFDDLKARHRASLAGEDAAGQLSAHLDSDLRRGHTGLGPHRDSLELSADGRPLASHGSAGQQRYSLLVLKAAKLEMARASGEMPLFLMDDVDSDLHLERTLRAVLHLASRAQVVVTTPREETAGELARHGALIRVEAGALGDPCAPAMPKTA